ncbi:hypothetical protein K435DRAFT_800240 [Dendrothele bispora CBS 962.96]|uniref:Uncharacterized protein n=1 Tax=Dendrothele bispora (strain CBS 962.96) TaxID=1314807 RepID=A0A4S8LUQ2_DENBC|nr:hypothetical protein K435DRAFT_800240 [Dendrothele bispora CBS 962.96]
MVEPMPQHQPQWFQIVSTSKRLSVKFTDRRLTSSWLSEGRHLHLYMRFFDPLLAAQWPNWTVDNDFRAEIAKILIYISVSKKRETAGSIMMEGNRTNSLLMLYKVNFGLSLDKGASVTGSALSYEHLETIITDYGSFIPLSFLVWNPCYEDSESPAVVYLPLGEVSSASLRILYVTALDRAPLLCLCVSTVYFILQVALRSRTLQLNKSAHAYVNTILSSSGEDSGGGVVNNSDSQNPNPAQNVQQGFVLPVIQAGSVVVCTGQVDDLGNCQGVTEPSTTSDAGGSASSAQTKSGAGVICTGQVDDNCQGTTTPSTTLDAGSSASSRTQASTSDPSITSSIFSVTQVIVPTITPPTLSNPNFSSTGSNTIPISSDTPSTSFPSQPTSTGLANEGGPGAPESIPAPNSATNTVTDTSNANSVTNTVTDASSDAPLGVSSTSPSTNSESELPGAQTSSHQEPSAAPTSDPSEPGPPPSSPLPPDGDGEPYGEVSGSPPSSADGQSDGEGSASSSPPADGGSNGETSASSSSSADGESNGGASASSSSSADGESNGGASASSSSSTDGGVSVSVGVTGDGVTQVSEGSGNNVNAGDGSVIISGNVNNNNNNNAINGGGGEIINNNQISSAQAGGDRGGAGGSGRGGFNRNEREGRSFQGSENREFLENPSSLDQGCVSALKWTQYTVLIVKIRLGISISEDIILLVAQFFMLAVGILSIVQKSISLSLTTLVLHLLSMSWAMFRVVDSDHLHADYDGIVEGKLCNGQVNILVGFWTNRRKFEIPTLAIDALGFVLSVIVTYIFITVSLFIIPSSVGLWLQDLFTGVSAHFASHPRMYQALAFLQVFLLIPWFITTWRSLDIATMKNPFVLVSTILSALYLISLSLIYIAASYRMVFLTYPFFAATAVGSQLLTATLLVLYVAHRYVSRNGVGTGTLINQPDKILLYNQKTSRKHPQRLTTMIPISDLPQTRLDVTVNVQRPAGRDVDHFLSQNQPWIGYRLTAPPVRRGPDAPGVLLRPCLYISPGNLALTWSGRYRRLQ